MAWKQFKEQWEKDWNEGKTDQVYKNRSYTRFFEDYEEQVVEEGGGKAALRREYIGDYYRWDCSDRDLRKRRILSVVCYLAALVLYVFCALQAVVYNAAALACVAQALVLVSLLWLLYPLFFRLTAPRQMKIHTWRNASVLFRRVSLFSAVAFGILTAVVLGLVIALRTDVFAGLLLAAGYALCGSLMAVNYLQEKNAAYEKLPGVRSSRFHEKERAQAR